MCPFSLEKQANKSSLPPCSSSGVSTCTTSGLLARRVSPSGHLRPRWCRCTWTVAAPEQQKVSGTVSERSGPPDPTLMSVPSLQCHTMPSTRPSGHSWNQDRSCWKSTGGAFLTSKLPCETRQCTGCFLLPTSVRTTSSYRTVWMWC